MSEHEIISNLACTYCRVCNLVDPVEGEPCNGTGPSYVALRDQLDVSMQTQEILAANVNAGLLEIRALRERVEQLDNTNGELCDQVNIAQNELCAAQDQIPPDLEGDSLSTALIKMKDQLATLTMAHQQAVEALAGVRTALKDAIHELECSGLAFDHPVITRLNKALSPKFATTSCSQCGQEFGPGDSGYSHCDQHKTTLHGTGGQ